MASKKASELVALIQSMSRGEKRRFILFAGGADKSSQRLYMSVYEVYESLGAVDDETLCRSVSGLKKSQLANIRAHLYQQLLACLRLLYADRTPILEVRACLDYALLLNQRGLQRAAMTMLEQALGVAEQGDHTSLMYHVVDEQRQLNAESEAFTQGESSHQASCKSRGLAAKVNLRDRLTELTLQLQHHYYKQGYVKNDSEFRDLKKLFFSLLPSIQLQHAGEYDKIAYYQTWVWYTYCIQDFATCYRYAARWVGVFEKYANGKDKEPVLYIKGLHHALNTLFMAGKKRAFFSYLQLLAQYDGRPADSISADFQSLHAEYTALHRCNAIFLTAQYDEGIASIAPVVQLLAKNPHRWHSRKRINLSYKMACVYFGADKYADCLHYLNVIIHSPEDGSQQDIRCFARILALICHYEMKNDLLVSYQIRSVYRYLTRMRDLQSVQRAILRFLKSSPAWQPYSMDRHFRQLRATLLPYRNHPYEKRPFLYLDILAWLESKLERKRIQEVIKSTQRTWQAGVRSH